MPAATFVCAQEMEAADNPTLKSALPDPTLVATGFKKHRFYLITRREPPEEKGFVHACGRASTLFRRVRAALSIASPCAARVLLTQ